MQALKWGSFHLILIAIADLDSELSKTANYGTYEPLWYKVWEEQKLFTPNDQPCDKYFSLILPPPNITGDLHLGHALTIAIEDAIYRYNRMKGRGNVKCVWLPGFDHAGIATQLVIDKMMQKQRNLRSSDVHATEFEQFANSWRDERFSNIRTQMKRLGAALDFTKEFYTLSDQMSHAVKEAFIRLFEQGVIYRKRAIVNWSYFLNSTLSDIEIDWLHFDQPRKITVPGREQPVEYGTLHSFAYPLENGDGEIVVSTTRLECLVGDTAVAVNPTDARYASLIGCRVMHPLTGKLLPVIGDERIDMNFGTGAMKVTPSHAAIDYALAVDHQLEVKCAFDDRGCITSDELLPEFKQLNGVCRFDAKDMVRDMLAQLGLYRGWRPHKTVVPTCARSGDVIEGNLLPQWFVNNSLLIGDVRAALEAGEMCIQPGGYKNSWLKWLNNIDWCISRQIAWGHRIPAYRAYVDGQPTDTWVAAHDASDAQQKALRRLQSIGTHQIDPRITNVQVVQDRDVLDTWFSSALLPFTALGWPRVDGALFKQFYPLSLMETGHDILGFWVSRMAVLSKRLTGQFAFRKVLLHGMVCDAHGKKMTKSLGNVIDPDDIVNGVTIEALHQKSDAYHARGLLTDKQLQTAKDGQRALFPNGMPACGADALRLSLFKQNAQHQILRLSVKNITANRHLINKFWQTYRFFALHAPSAPHDHRWLSTVDELAARRAQLAPHHRWILSRLANFVGTCNDKFELLELHAVYAAAISFWVDELCACYLERIKPTLHAATAANKAAAVGSGGGAGVDQNELSNALNVLHVCLRTTLLCVHPLVPFVSEELFQRLTRKTGSRHNSCATDAGSGCNITSILDAEQGYPGAHDFRSTWLDWRDEQIDRHYHRQAG